MPETGPQNFLALLTDFDIRLIDVSQPLQIELSGELARQRSVFFEEYSDEIPFEADYTPSPGEVLYIEGFELPANMRSALQSPLSVQRLSEKELPNVRGLFTGSADGREVSLQVFDRRRLLSTAGISLILDRGTFRKLTEEGLTLDTKIVSAVAGKRLYFNSFALARRLFDLSTYFKEATDEDLETFSEHKAVRFDDPDSLQKNADSWVRKKVALILQSGILDRKPSEIAVAAQAYGLAFQVQKIGKQEKLLFPSEKKRLKEVLHFLDEDYLTSLLTGTQFLSNSKRRLQIAQRRQVSARRPASKRTGQKRSK